MPMSVNEPNGRRLNGKMKTGNFALVRSLHDVVDLGSYPPIFPLLERSKTNAAYTARFKGNYTRLSDFAPFLLVSRSSARFLSSKCDAEYPTRSFRGNIVVDGEELEPWVEESWASFDISSPNGKHDTLSMVGIKPCPRCTVPCRDQTNGKFLFRAEKLKLWKVLKALYPRKYSDPEWGLWAGAFMGLYVGHSGQTGQLAVGDVITPTLLVPWDAHLTRELRIKILTVLSVLVALFAVGIPHFLK